MSSSGKPTIPTPAELYPPAKPVPVAPPSAAQRRAEAESAHQAAHPPVKGNSSLGANCW